MSTQQTQPIISRGSNDAQKCLNDAVVFRGLFSAAESESSQPEVVDRNIDQPSTNNNVKKRDCEDNALDDGHSSKCFKATFPTIKMIQEALLGTLLAPFLPDRMTFNSFACASRELHEVCKLLPAPWPRQTLPVHAVAQSLSFSPCGQMLACCSGETIHVWNRQTGSKRLIDTSAQITSVAFSPDGNYLASGHRSQTSSEHDFLLRENNDVCVVRLWDVKSLDCIQIFRGDQHGGMFAVAFSPDSKTIAAGGADQYIRLWNIQDGTCLETLQGHSSWIYSLKFSPDGKHLASSGEDETEVLLWDLDTFQMVSLEGHTESVHCVAFTPDGQYLVSGSDDETICLWNLHDNFACTILKGNLCSVWTIACTPDSKNIVSGSRDGDENPVIRVWNIKQECSISSMRGHLDYITSLSFSPSGRTLASASFDCSVRTWNVATETSLNVATCTDNQSVTISRQ
jgi:WD40 repeat protein